MLAIAGPSNLAACRRPSIRLGTIVARKYADASTSNASPRPALDIDPSFQEMFSTLTPDFKQKAHKHPKPPVELHVYEPVSEHSKGTTLPVEHAAQDADHEADRREERRSPAAVFGSQKIGHVILSDELDRAVTKLIARGDKHQLRSDAKRLFLHPTPASATSSKWSTILPKHKSKSKDRQMAPRDGLAFLAVGMPAHYSVLTRVLSELKHRLEPEWGIEQVVDFGAKTGAGLWACKDALGGIKHYVGIDSRTGITHLAQELNALAESDSSMKVAFVKQWGKGLRSSPDKSLALCAFTLSELKTDLDRKMMLRELWNSGAETIVIIDHGTKEGFQYVGNAREYLLKRGRKELSTDVIPEAGEAPTETTTRPLGSHVVAPCPHDGTCPLHAALLSTGDKKPTRLMKTVPQMGPTSFCHFTQRLHRPEFVRLTKHSHQSHEDVLYSYVVVRRGPRPSVNPSYTQPITESDNGWSRNRSGAVAREVQQALELKQRMEEGGPSVVVENEDGELHFVRGTDAESVQASEPLTHEEQLKDAEGLRNEAYTWPRVIYPPMKRSGHVVLDSCTPDGNISRITIPKSQGKQPYLDARKSGWGDIFPHAPKNGLEVRKRGQPTPTQTSSNVEEAEDEKELAELLSRLQSKDGTYEFMV